MSPDPAEATLRSLLRDMQRAGDLSPQTDVYELSMHATLEQAGFDSVARLTLAAMIEERLGVALDEDVGDDTTTLFDVAALLKPHVAA